MITERLKKLSQSDQDALNLAFEEERTFSVKCDTGEYISVHLSNEPPLVIAKEGFWTLWRNPDDVK